MNTKFPVLSAISKVLWAIGWLIALAGVVYGFYNGVYEPNLPGHAFMQGDAWELMEGMIVLGLGLFVVAISEIIGVLFAIEQNTRTHRVDAALAAAPLSEAVR
jgi:hypothetical protein